jgi:hypothetical protein
MVLNSRLCDGLLPSNRSIDADLLAAGFRLPIVRWSSLH